MARITSFRITNFRQINGPLDVPLHPITVLIGLNNSGKTTILEALNIFQYCLDTCLATDGNGNSRTLTLKSKNIGPDEFGRLPVATPADLWPQGKTTKSTIRLTATFEDRQKLTFEITFRYNLFNIKPVTSQTTDLDALLGNTGIRLVPIFSGLLPREEYLRPAGRLERERAQRHGEIVRNMMLYLKKEHKGRFNLLRQKLRELYPDANLDVDYDEELGRRVPSAQIDSSYDDSVLTKKRDLIVAGSGVHQAVQILAGALQPHATLILLDEPDAHLHARLQENLMRVLKDLADQEGLQFVVATHSPQILRAVPEDSILICSAGAVVPFHADASALDLLDSLGAIDRMELVPLLQCRRVVFVEDRDDRKMIELFARKQFGETKAEMILKGVTFLYTYQEPVTARVLEKARQVRDLIQSPSVQSLGGTTPVRFLSIGDRDYRTAKEIRSDQLKLRKTAKTAGYGFDFRLKIWPRTEIENYLLDRTALEASLESAVANAGRKKDLHNLTTELDRKLTTLIDAQRPLIVQRYANHLQSVDRRLELTTAMRRAQADLHKTWGDGTTWCDAKEILARLRAWAQSQKLPGQTFNPRRIIDYMDEAPDDVRSVLTELRKLSRGSSGA